MSNITFTDEGGWGFVLLGWGLFGFLMGLHTYLHRRLIAQTPTSKIQSAALGTVELAGKICQEASLVSPFCQIPCAYYRYKVEEERQNSKGRTNWSTILEGQSNEPFFMEDETGRM